jgi:exosortase/archaeosortase family protein
MEENLKKILLKSAILVGMIFLTRMIFQFPVEFFHLDILKQSYATRLFSKINALEVLSLVALFFILYFRNKIIKIPHPKIKTIDTILLFLGAESLVGAYYLLRFIANYHDISVSSGPLLWLFWLAVIAILGGSFLLFSCAVFGPRYIMSFCRLFWKELIVAGIVSVVLYFLLMIFQDQWLFFSTGVSSILYSILSLAYPVTYSISDSGPILQIYDFAVSIGAPCSGIDSMFLFIAFFAGIFALDHKKIRRGRYVILLITGLAGVYAMNILRLLLLILVGIHISPDLAVGLFHTNAGWVLFVVYFLCYYLVIKRFIYEKSNTRRE